MIQTLKEAKAKVIGLKQTLRAIQQDRIRQVIIAADIEDHILKRITDACREAGIPMVPANMGQRELGRLCRIEVSAAVVGLMK
jgi:large subunit ribosomal protein L7A